MAEKKEELLDPVEESEEYSESYEESESVSETSPLSLVSALTLNTKAEKEESNAQTYDEESDIHQDITLNIQLPEGKEQIIHCKTGETIINLKKRLYDELQIPFSCTITYKDQKMIDPLSLNDFPELLAASKTGAIELKLTL